MKNLISTHELTDRQPHFLRLSRIGDELSVMLSELHSYKCEPCTPDMHEQYLELNGHGRLLKQTIDKTANLVHDSTDISQAVDEEVCEIVSKYQLFQKNISSYLAEAVMHH